MCKPIVCLILLLLSLILITGCGPSKKDITDEAPKSGFVAEIDEPSTRGQLTRISPPDMFVSWRFAVSPGGESVIFSGKRVKTNEPFQLYRMDKGSNAPVKITSGGDYDHWDPSFTGDNKHLVFRTNETFWKVRKDGSGAKVRVPGSGLNRDYFPQASSSDRIAFVTFDDISFKFVIWTIGIDGSELTQYREGNFPVWSPDGTKLAFEYENDIWMMNSDGTELTQLTSTKDVIEAKPSFSYDGTRIAYVSNEGPRGEPIKDINIWYMTIDGTSKTQVTQLDSWDSWPVWAKDGIYFLSGRAKGKHNIQRIWRIKID